MAKFTPRFSSLSSATHAEKPTLSPSIEIDSVNTSEFARFSRDHGLEIFGVFLPPRDGLELNAVLTTHEYATSTIPLDSRSVPEMYSDFSDVFALKSEPPIPLPPHRDYDLKITLDEAKPLPKPGKIYPLSPDETEALRLYIDNALARGWIRPTKSPIGAPCFFVKKPNGGLCLCIDYRDLNAVTIKDKYPIPLFQDFIDDFSKSEMFTQLDFPDAYHLVRIAEGDEWKSAFRSKFGNFEYQVVSFGLMNAPPVFQFFMNDGFKDLIAEGFVKIYLDNVFIHSRKVADHPSHVRRVLSRVRDLNLFVTPDKCSFHLKEIDFLGYIISTKGLKMDPAKVKAVSDWEPPSTVKQVQSFLAFANFYRRFIKDFSKITRPLSVLTRKDVSFIWSTECDMVFNLLKSRFTSAPILHYFDFSKPSILETDASDFALGAVISQYDDDGVLHPIAFHSRSFLAVGEINYDTHDKELLAIVDAFKVWRHYLIAAPPSSPTLVISDHHNLLHFESSQQLNRRQHRWAQFLSQFHFQIHFRPGKQGGKPDALSRRSAFQKEGDTLRSKNFLRLFERIEVDSLALSSLSSSAEFLDDLRTATSTSSLLTDFHASKLSSEYSFADSLLFFDNLVVIPSVPLQLEVLRQRHSSLVAGHFGVAKTVELISRDYHWPGLRKSVKKYIRGCDVCSRTKSSRHAPYGLLQPLPVPSERWQDVSLDFITDLPDSRGFDSICVIKDRLTKQAHFIACNKTITAEQLAELFIAQIFRLHGCPKSLLSDRGPQFVSAFWKRFLELLGIERLLTSGYHPETNGGNEVLNQVVEHYLRVFCSYQQDNWFSLLPISEFVYNNSVNSSTQMTPFFADKGYHPIFDPTIIQASVVPSAEDRFSSLKVNVENLKANMRAAQDSFTVAANRSRSPAPSLQVGDLVFLNRKNIATLRPTRKFDDKKFGPFKIRRKLSDVVFELSLPPSMRIHPIFHVSLLEPRSKDTFVEQTPIPPAPVILDDVEEFEVNSVLDSKWVGRSSSRSIRYLVDWVGYSPADRTWEPLSSLLNAPDALEAFRRNYPFKPFQVLPSSPPTLSGESS